MRHGSLSSFFFFTSLLISSSHWAPRGREFPHGGEDLLSLFHCISKLLWRHSTVGFRREGHDGSSEFVFALASAWYFHSFISNFFGGVFGTVSAWSKGRVSSLDFALRFLLLACGG